MPPNNGAEYVLGHCSYLWRPSKALVSSINILIFGEPFMDFVDYMDLRDHVE